MEDMKRCKRCEEVKHVDEFHLNGPYRRLECKECRAISTREYNAATIAQRSERRRNRRVSDPERAREIDRRYYEQRKARGGRLPKRLRTLVIETYGECAQCGTDENLTVDHIRPQAAGGSHDWDNLQCLCKLHNEMKFTKVIDYRKNPLPDPRVTNE